MAFIHIDPAHPVVWRSPRSLQIGGQPALVTFDPLTQRDERMLAAARAGIPVEGLAAVGGCSPADATAFVDRIRPALATPAPARDEFAIRITSSARAEVARVARALELVGSASTCRPGVGIVVADHAVPLRAYRDWMREGLAHFAVVFGTNDVAIGPVVVPGETGCLRCADLRRHESDPAWPAVAAQLVERPAAAALDPVARVEALSAAARLAHAIAAGAGKDPIAAWDGIRIDARSGAVSPGTPIEPHPDCGCMLDLQAPLALVG